MKHTEYIVPIGDEAENYDELFIGVIRTHPALVRCKDCKHRPVLRDPGKTPEGFNLVFPDETCPGLCDDPWFSWMPADNWFCGYGERINEDQ